MDRTLNTYGIAVPYWKRWLLRYIIREAPAITLESTVAAENVIIKFGKPGGYNTVERLFKWYEG